MAKDWRSLAKFDTLPPTMTNKTLILVAGIALLLPLTACNRTSGPSERGQMSQNAQPPAQSMPSNQPSGTPQMVGSNGQAAGGSGAMAPGGMHPATELHYKLPADWKAEKPASSMRLAQASIPGKAGAGQLAIFYFGPGQGGTVDANIKRWENEVKPAAGATPKIESFAVGSLKVTWVDAKGTLMPSQMGMGPSSPQSGYRLFGAVVEGPGGPWFLKVIGPSATLEAQQKAWLDLLHGLSIG